LNMPIQVVRSEQACALGSGMAAATAAAIHPSVTASQEAMGNGFESEYRPDSAAAAQYEALYTRYRELGRYVEEHFTVRER